MPLLLRGPCPDRRRSLLTAAVTTGVAAAALRYYHRHTSAPATLPLPAPAPAPAGSKSTTATATSSSSSSSRDKDRMKVAIFWDVTNKPIRAGGGRVSAMEAALRLSWLAAHFGRVSCLMAFLPNAYANSADAAPEPYTCPVCGHKLKTAQKLRKHFTQLHQRQQRKRLRTLHSCRGHRRTAVLHKLQPKMERYEDAAAGARTLLRRGSSRAAMNVAEELGRAGFRVKSDKHDKSVLCRSIMEAASFHGHGYGLWIVSDDERLATVVRASASAQGVRTVVVGQCHELRRCAHKSFSWFHVISGHALKQVPFTLRLWSDQTFLTPLQWSPPRYSPDNEVQQQQSQMDDERGCFYCFGDQPKDRMADDAEDEEEFKAEEELQAANDLERLRHERPWWKLPPQQEQQSQQQQNPSSSSAAPPLPRQSMRYKLIN